MLPLIAEHVDSTVEDEEPRVLTSVVMVSWGLAMLELPKTRLGSVELRVLQQTFGWELR